MKTRVVPPGEIDPKKGLTAESYVSSNIALDPELRKRIEGIIERRKNSASVIDVHREALLVGLSALESSLDELDGLKA